MSTLDERLAWARKQAGYEGPAEAARALGIKRYTYTQHENGTRGFKRDSAVQYAKKFKVSLEWLLTGKGAATTKPSGVPITQYLGAGATVIPFPDQGTLDIDELPADLSGYEAAIVRGDSMPPFQDGWLIIWKNDNLGISDGSIGKLCVVDVREGPTLVKILRKGTKQGLWTLESWKGAKRENVAINWAAPVLYIKPR